MKKNIDQIKKAMSFFWDNDIDCFAAGGSIAAALNVDFGIENQDIDVFFPNVTEFLKAEKLLLSEKAKINLFENQNAKNVAIDGIEFGLVKRYGTIKEVLNTFDFSGCRLAVSKNGLFADNVDLQCAKKKIIICSLEIEKQTPLQWAKRIKKYKAKGWLLPQSQAEEIINILGIAFVKAWTIVSISDEKIEYP